jgi:hypothetical protein
MRETGCSFEEITKHGHNSRLLMEAL